MDGAPTYVRLDDETQAYFALAMTHARGRVGPGGIVEITAADSDWAAIQQLLQSDIAQSHLRFVQEMAIR